MIRLVLFVLVVVVVVVVGREQQGFDLGPSAQKDALTAPPAVSKHGKSKDLDLF